MCWSLAAVIRISFRSARIFSGLLGCTADFKSGSSSGVTTGLMMCNRLDFGHTTHKVVLIHCLIIVYLCMNHTSCGACFGALGV